MHSRRTGHRRGYILTELLVSIAVFGIVLAFFGVMFSHNMRAFNRAKSREYVEEQVTTIVKKISRNIREMRSSDAGAYPLSQATDTSITFFSNIDSDDDIERVRYTLNGTLIELGIIQPTGTPASYPVNNEIVTTIARGVYNGGQPLFSYFDSSFTGSQQPLTLPVNLSSVRVVKVQAFIDDSPTQEPAAQELVFYVQLRNLKDNY